MRERIRGKGFIWGEDSFVNKRWVKLVMWIDVVVKIQGLMIIKIFVYFSSQKNKFWIGKY